MSSSDSGGPFQGISNPYAFSNLSGPPDDGTEGDAVLALHRVLDPLNRTRPWVILFGVLLVIGGLVMIAGMCFVGFTFFVGVGGGGGIGGVESLVILMLTATYLGMGALYFLGAKFLFSYANGIKEADRTRSLFAVARALECQKSFWKLAGISVVVVFGFYLLAMIGMMAFAAVGSIG